MRSHAIILRGTSLKERIELKEFLKSKDEPVYELSSAFSKQEFESTAVYFHYKNYDKEWAIGSRSFNAITIKDFIKKFSTPSQKRNLAFCKESGEPWTPEELRNIYKYCGDTDTITNNRDDAYKRKWVYDDGSSTAFMWMWIRQDFPSSYTCLSYESVFNNQPDICVGDRYNNSVGKLCIVEEIKSENKIRFLHEDGNYYNTSSATIKSHWTKIKSTLEKESTMKHICEVLESKISLQSAINFAQFIMLNNAASNIHSSVERRIIDAISWEETPQGDDYWSEIHRKLSPTNNVSIDEETFKKYAAMTTTSSSESTQLSIKKETFMSKLKSTALTTIEQNKEAALIAAKMEAGRVLNKQVIKQLTPHLPFFVQGYAKSPLAPVIVANIVAMIGNHTNNEKVRKVGELMLLGAADATVQSFNLDKIIDDILKGIKLPAGVLDADDN